MGFTTGTNLYRHMRVTDNITENTTAEDKLKLAELMNHTVAVQKLYIRKNAIA